MTSVSLTNAYVKANRANPSQALLFAGSADLPIDCNSNAGVTLCSGDANEVGHAVSLGLGALWPRTRHDGQPLATPSP